MTIRATFDIEPATPAAAAVLAAQLSTGAEGMGPAWAQGQVASLAAGRAMVELDEAIWGDSPAVLVSALIAGEAMETKAFSRCRLVDLELPDGYLPGPAIGAADTVDVGLIVKPSVGLGPAEVADVVRAAVAGGARLVKDDEVMGDPLWCPLEKRVAAVAEVLEPGVAYFANVTGPSPTLVERARRAVDLGSTGVMVNAFAQGLDSLVALRHAGLGVPVLAHRAGSGPMARNPTHGPSGAVLARLLRLVGADHVIVGAFGGKLFETDADVDTNLVAVRAPCGSARPSTALLGGGLGPADVAAQVERAGGTGLVVLLGSAAYAGTGGIQAAVAAAVEALR
ncbi:MAG: RuBisCO large subunit C-terminal-like domain-containing protein [Acidimicrobiales bacterium]